MSESDLGSQSSQDERYRVLRWVDLNHNQFVDLVYGSAEWRSLLQGTRMRVLAGSPEVDWRSWTRMVARLMRLSEFRPAGLGLDSTYPSDSTLLHISKNLDEKYSDLLIKHLRELTQQPRRSMIPAAAEPSHADVSLSDEDVSALIQGGTW